MVFGFSYPTLTGS